MPRRYLPEIRRQVVELARAGTRVKQLVMTFGMSEATIYNWLKQEQIDRAIWLLPAPGGPISRRNAEPAGSCMSSSAHAIRSTGSPCNIGG
jgi:transposase-like protein